MAERRVPRIRFKGFEEDWEQRKLGEISQSFSGGTPSVGIREYYGGEIPFIRSAEINNEETELFLTEKGLKESSAKIVDIGDILYALYGATSGEVSRAKIKGAINQAVLAITPDKEYDAEYLVTWLHKNKQRIIDTYLQGGQGNLSGNIVKNLMVRFPLTKEQYKIGRLFWIIDSLLSLHQRKLEKLKILKKAMLEKMFPKNGEKVPEIRFSGFADDWEQRKLGEVVNEITRTDENSDAPVMMITASDGFINQSERYSTDNAGQSLRRYILLERGELAYNHGASKLRPYGSCFALTTEEKARVPFVYHCFSTEREEPELLSLVLNGKSVELQLRKIVSSGARMDGLLNISFEEYSSIPINLPIKLEQTKIVDFFRSLDKVISLHQRKLEKLRQIKKSMLERMFV